MLLKKLVEIGPLEPHGVPHHHQVDVLALQAPGGLGPGIAGGGRHHQMTKPLGHGPVHQFQTGRGVLRTHAREIPHLSLNHQLTSWILLGDEKLGSLYQIALRSGRPAGPGALCGSSSDQPPHSCCLPNLPIRTGKAGERAAFLHRFALKGQSHDWGWPAVLIYTEVAIKGVFVQLHTKDAPVLKTWFNGVLVSGRAGRKEAFLEVQRTSGGNSGEPSKRAISWG